MSQQIRKMVFAGLCLALCLLLPLLTGQIPEIGKRLSPMHIPVFLCGFICGWPWALAVGIIAPPLRSAIFLMPTMFPDAVCMCFELAAYGLVSGILYKKLPKKPWSIYSALIAAMIAGRLVWGLAKWAILGLSSTPFTMKMFLTGSVINALPGIILHILLVPVLVMLLEKSGFIKEINQ